MPGWHERMNGLEQYSEELERHQHDFAGYLAQLSGYQARGIGSASTYTSVTLPVPPPRRRQMAQGQARPGWASDRWKGE